MVLAVEPEIDGGEDPDEDELIELALIEDGYFRDDVPMPYELQDALHAACEEFDIDYALALGLIQKESEFDIDIVNSRTGCYGLCQLNPKYFPSGLSPQENIYAGMEYLRYNLDRYGGDVMAALTGYHAGHDNGDRAYAVAVLEMSEMWSL